MTPDQLSQFVVGAGATGVLLAVFYSAIKGLLRFKPGVDGEVQALREARDEALKDRDYWREHATQLATAVDKLGDAVDYANRRLRDDRGT